MCFWVFLYLFLKSDKAKEDPQSLRFPPMPQDLPVEEGTDLSLQCAADGRPRPEIRLYKDGELVAKASPGDGPALFNKASISE